MKKIKRKKLSFEKITILELNSLKKIRGGAGPQVQQLSYNCPPPTISVTISDSVSSRACMESSIVCGEINSSVACNGDNISIVELP